MLFLCALVAIAVAVMRANGSVPEMPWPPGMVVASAGALATVIILFRIIVPGDGPLDELAGIAGVDPDATRKIGAFIGLIAAGAMAYGGYTAINERASGVAPAAGGTGEPPPPPPPASERHLRHRRRRPRSRHLRHRHRGLRAATVSVSACLGTASARAAGRRRPIAGRQTQPS